MIWLGESGGYLTDWVTQLWVQLTGRRVNLADDPWLFGPVSKPRGIGLMYFDDLARDTGLAVRRGPTTRDLIAAFDALRGPTFDPTRVHHAVFARVWASAAMGVASGFGAPAAELPIATVRRDVQGSHRRSPP
jgi:hypothetical protein